MHQHGTQLTLELGELIVALHDSFLEEYGDEELATLATATVLQERVAEGSLHLAEGAAEAA